MTRYIIRRLLITLPVLLGVTVIVFALIRLTPGDPAVMIAGPGANPEQLALIRAHLGLDKHLVTQYFMFMGNLFQGDLGTSLRSGMPVIDEIMARLPNTFLLAFSAGLISIVMGVVVGIIGGVKHYSAFDYLSMLLVLFGIALPVFWLGLLLMLVFSVKLGWLPTTGVGSWRHLILPSVSLAAACTAFIARMARSSVLEVLQQEYVRTARGKGLIERSVILRHVLKNALIPVVTMVGILMGTLLGGSILVEMVFAWPGLGRLLVRAILFRDYAVVQGVILVFALVFILINLAVDISYAYIDPRIHYE